MNILAIDTATEVCSVALHMRGKVVEVFENRAPQASRIIMNMVDLLFSQVDCRWSDIDLLAFCHGPGSFTGVRVATGLVQGLALGHSLPVMGISTLAVIAHRALNTSDCAGLPVLSVLDARMGEFYWGCYCLDEHKRLQTLGEDHISSLEEIRLPGHDQPGQAQQWLAAGNACESHAEVIEATIRIPGSNDGISCLQGVYPHASSLLALAEQRLQQGEQGVEAAMVRPVYLRDRVVA